ncbi:hypothetical protein GDO86_012731 [Hymenochirus boettgeri]|uniref:Carotenoid-cleaving dioxygenase, mitochondrial n=1 Tax=Hymenochirus boettgeri TaxID=247094 RepID=A0A8T2ITS5_9PIPI|nr:hypothetical protein GDO86_012731 [Hymenochirus boettgeri]
MGAVGVSRGLQAGTGSLKKLLSLQNLHFSSQAQVECMAPLFQTVSETPKPVQAKVFGTIPEWINGSLLRNGPGQFEFGEDKYNHWFDGMALMHQFKIKNGAVTYMSKFLESDSYKLNKSQNRIVASEFGTLAVPDPCKTLYDRFMSKFKIDSTDNCNVNYVLYKGDYYVSTETNFMRKVDPEALDTLEKVDWSKFIAVNGATAHPHYDPDGTSYNMGNSYGKQGTRYNIIKVPSQKSASEETLEGAQVICSIEPQEKMKPSYYHSFGMTENYVVFIELPLKLNLMKIITSKIRGKSFSSSLSWEPDFQTIFHVVNKHTGEPHSVLFYTKPFMSFHQINAYEDQGCIVIDLCGQDGGEDLDALSLQNLRKSEHTLDKVWCTHENLQDHSREEYGLEFPQINYKYNARKYRYFYGCGFPYLVAQSLVKMDVQIKKPKVWKEKGFYPSEPIFVPYPNSVEEDKGVILSAVLTPHQDKNIFLLVLDAKDFVEIGRAEVPVKMPYGFHGIFVPQKS